MSRSPGSENINITRAVPLPAANGRKLLRELSIKIMIAIF